MGLHTCLFSCHNRPVNTDDDLKASTRVSMPSLFPPGRLVFSVDLIIITELPWPIDMRVDAIQPFENITIRFRGQIWSRKNGKKLEKNGSLRAPKFNAF